MNKMSVIQEQGQPSVKRPFTRRDFLSTGLKAGAAAFTTGLLPKRRTNADSQYSVLFISLDDMNTMLGCYGHLEMHTPNIDQLAERGTLFKRAYCQFPLCNPSRFSVLTGLRPDTTGITNNDTAKGDTFGSATIPQYFKEHHYYTRAVGKIAHGWLAWSDKVSWSERVWALSYESEYFGARPTHWKALDVADDELRDGKTASKAVEVLAEIKDLPFFLAIGFDRPHVPFHAPTKYFDLYTPQDFTLPAHSRLPKNAPRFSLVGEPSKFSDTKNLELLQAYAACISYVDAQVGRVLRQLERLGLMEKTIIVLWGDHGFHVGEHGKWEKNTLFEVGVQTPLIISVPGQSNVGVETDALVELVDVYPTLCDACQLPIPTELEGHSMLPVIEQPASAYKWKSAAFSQLRRRLGRTYYRGASLRSLTGVDLSRDDSVDGYSMRTDRYRYTEWGAYSASGEKIADVGAELYDYNTDPNETLNIADLSENTELVARLSAQLHAGWQAALPDMQQPTSISQMLPWDINNDGIVDIEDLILISNSFGVEILEHPKADVNKDGEVNILDLLLVAAHFGESIHPTAPSRRTAMSTDHFDLVEQWLTEARLLDDGSLAFHQGVAALEHLINTAVPMETVLLPNYPNPFNPETWVPYDLAEDANVHIHIYNMKGEPIRQLSIGFQTAGTYRTPSRAAYWDGRNTIGEPVASGVYFYTLQAGHFEATRRMVMIK